MRNYRNISSGLDTEALQLKKRISRNRSRTILVGLLYTIMVVVLAAVAALLIPSFVSVEGGNNLTVLNFYKLFADISANVASSEGRIQLAVGVAYTAMLLTSIICLIVAITKLGWLFKKTANDVYGFNRNVYAMLDLGNIFASSFIAFVVNYVLIILFNKCGDIGMMFMIVAGACVLVHLLGGFIGAKASFYDIREEKLIEQKRELGRAFPLLRNVVQIAVLAFIIFMLVQINVTVTGVIESENVNITASIFDPIIGVDGILAYLKASSAGTLAPDFDFMNLVGKLVYSGMLILAAALLIIMLKHAMSVREYNIDGPEGKRMCTYRVCSILMVILMLGALVGYSLKEVMAATASSSMLQDILAIVKVEPGMSLLIIAGVCLVVFILGLIFRKHPKLSEEKLAEKEVKALEETETESIATNADSRNVVENNNVRNVAPGNGYIYYDPMTGQQVQVVDNRNNQPQHQPYIGQYMGQYLPNYNNAMETSVEENQTEEKTEVLTKKEARRQAKLEKKEAKKQAKLEKKEAKKQAKREEKAARTEKRVEYFATSNDDAKKSAAAAPIAAGAAVGANGLVYAAPNAPVMANGMQANIPYVIQAAPQVIPVQSAPQIIPIPIPVPYSAPQQAAPQPQQPNCAQCPQTNIPMPVNNMAMNNSSMMPLLAGMAMMPVLNGLGNAMSSSMMQKNGMLPSEMLQSSGLLSDKRKAAKLASIMEEAEVKKPTKEEKKTWEMMKNAPVVSPINEDMDEFEEELSQIVKVDVDCPFCHKKLRVNSASKYNRCPSCQKIFQLRKS